MNLLRRFFRFACIFLIVLLLFPYNVSAVASESSLRTPAEFRSRIGDELLMSSLYEADITSLRSAIDQRLLSCEELTAFYLERIDAYNKDYNCFITLCDNALEIARQRDRQLAEGTNEGTLFGIPIVVKDNMDYAGYRTTNGYAFNDDQFVDTNAVVVANLLNEGAIVLGKANMSAGAQVARITRSASVGETKNAYNRAMASGGSSGGTAVSVSLNFAAAGLGTDTNSSLRMPAVLNGCISLRTTFGLFSLDGIQVLNRTRDVPGVISRTVADQVLMLDAMSGGATCFAENLNPNVLNRLKIGVLKELVEPINRVDLNDAYTDDEVIAAFETALDELTACGAEIVTVSMPEIFQLSEATMDNNLSAPKDQLYQAFCKAMEKGGADVAVFPSYMTTPLRSGRDSSGVYYNPMKPHYVTNCYQLSPSASLPEIAIPIGIHSLGAGIGMEIAGFRNEEQLLLDIAYAYTTRYDHRVTPSGAANLYDEVGTVTLPAILAAYEAYLSAPLPAPSSTPSGDPTESATASKIPTSSTTVSTQPASSQPTPSESISPESEPASSVPEAQEPGTRPEWWIGAGISATLILTFLFFRNRQRRCSARATQHYTDHK